MSLNNSRDKRLIFKSKAADETVNNTAVYHDDTELYFTAAAGESYAIFVNMLVTSPAAADFKWKIVGTNLSGRFTVFESGGYSAYGVNEEVTNGTPGTEFVISVQGVISKTVSNGTVKIQWAQLTQAVGDTILQKGTSFIALRL